jgi:hypothetical protein
MRLMVAARMLFASAALFCCLRKSCCSVLIQPTQLCMLLAVKWDNRKVLWYKERYFLIMKANEMNYFSNFFDKALYMFQTW